MFRSLVAFASLALSVVATSSSPTSAVRVVYTFTDGAYPENVAVRPNGDLLINSLSNGRIYTLNPTSPNPSARVLVQLTPDVASGFTGLTEYAPDKFAAISGKFNLANFTTEEAAVWTFDAGRKTVTPKKVAGIPGAGVPNGLTTLGSVLLAADSSLGVVWGIDIRRGVARKVAEDDALKATVAGGHPLGVNGIRVGPGGVYFTNSNTQTLNKVSVRRDGSFKGNVSVVAHVQGVADDFTFGKDGRVWVTGLPTFLNVVHPDGKVDVRDVFVNEANPGAGNPTAAAFGRGSKAQEKVLYVVTSWGAVYAVDTTRI